MPLLRQRLRIAVFFISIFSLGGVIFAENKRLDIPVPLNEDVLGIRIPYYSEAGKLEMQFEAHIARKTDENHVTLENLKISLFEEDSDTVYIEMQEGIFALQTNILYGKKGVEIKRQDMDLTAESIIFHTQDRSAHFKGKVKMTITELDLVDNPK